MKTFIKSFRGVPAGEIYPKTYGAGDECPPELEDAATAAGALGDQEDAGDMTVAQMRTALDAKGVTYKANASKAELAALLHSQPAA